MVSKTGSSMRAVRARWAAVGAAVAVTLGAGGIGMAQAQIGSGEKPITVTIEPRRILDTRFGIGLDGGFSTNSPRDLQVTGSVEVAGPDNSTLFGTVVPAGASAVIVNVTVVEPTHFGYLSVRPADAAGVPTTSTLNFTAGSIEPNAATVDLSPSGVIELWLVTTSVTGTSDVLVDVLGYTFDHHHDDRYPTADEVVGALALKADTDEVYTKSEVYTKAEVDAKLPGPAQVGVAAWSFVASGSDLTMDRSSGGCVYIATKDIVPLSSQVLYGSLQLPVGATVTGVSAAMIDSSNAADATLEVWVSDGDNGGLNEIGSVSTSGFPGFQRNWSSSLTPTQLADGQFVFFEFDGVADPPEQLQICGVQLTYQLD